MYDDKCNDGGHEMMASGMTNDTWLREMFHYKGFSGNEAEIGG